MLLFMRGLFQNTILIDTFKRYLVEMSKNDLSRLLSLYTELYRILEMIQSEDNHVVQFK